MKSRRRGLPQGLGPRKPRSDYSRDLRPAEWGSGVSLHDTNPEPPMSASLIGRLRVKHFQTIRRCCLDVAHGLVLLFGIGTKALPLWDSRTRWSNLYRGVAVRRTAGPSRHANSPHPSSREGHHSIAWWSSNYLLWRLICYFPCQRSLIRCHVPSAPIAAIPTFKSATDGSWSMSPTIKSAAS
jgi:hypothetical protein